MAELQERALSQRLLGTTSPEDFANNATVWSRLRLGLSGLSAAGVLTFAVPPVGLGWHDVKAYGAVGDGVTDDTAAIRLTQAAAEAVGGMVMFPSGNYVMGRIAITGACGWIPQGKVTLTLTGSDAGIRADGSFEWFNLGPFRFAGDGNLASAQVAYAPKDSSCVVTNLLIDRAEASNVMMGFDASVAKRVTMIAPRVLTTVGTAGGSGYGIVCGGSGVYTEDVFIVAPYLYRTSRHGIYLGAAKRVQVLSPVFYQHAFGSVTYNKRSALVLSRGTDLLVSNPQFISCADEGIAIDDDNAFTGQADFLQVLGGSMRDPQGAFVSLRIGSGGVPSADATVKRVVVRDLQIELNVNNVYPSRDILITDGSDVLIDGLQIDGAQQYDATSKEIISISGDGTYYGAVTVKNCGGRVTGTVADRTLVRIADENATGSRVITVIGNAVSGLSTLRGVTSGLLGSNTIITNVNVRTDAPYAFVITGATPTVSMGWLFTLSQSGATNVTNFLGGQEGDTIVVHFTDGNSTLKTTNLTLAGAVDFVATNLDVITLQYRAGSWRELGRSVN